MNNYPEVVAKIAHDYLERVKSQLQLVPVRERIEFLREIESHIYEQKPLSKQGGCYRPTYFASLQLSPVPMSTTSGTDNWQTPSISCFTMRETASSSSGGHSKTNSSCTWSSMADAC